MSGRPQRTVKGIASIEGVGLHTGEKGVMRFLPAPVGHGVRFVRTDLPGNPEVRVRPENAYSFPDWDLIARGFLDAAKVEQNGTHTDNDHDERMWSMGFGGELRLSRYFSASLDVAFAQRRLFGNDPDLEKPRLHAVITVLY